MVRAGAVEPFGVAAIGAYHHKTLNVHCRRMLAVSMYTLSGLLYRHREARGTGARKRRTSRKSPPSLQRKGTRAVQPGPFPFLKTGGLFDLLVGPVTVLDGQRSVAPKVKGAHSEQRAKSDESLADNFPHPPGCGQH